MLDIWFHEEQDGTATGFKIKKILFDEKSDFQQVSVVETTNNGKLLLLDKLVMLTEHNEFVYHDMIVHPALFVHPNPEKVLIIGAGDGGTAREVLRHKTVKQVDMVEIDGMVVDVCKKFGFNTATAFNDPRLNVMIDDGIRFVRDARNEYDVILIDSTDPIGPAEGLFGLDFYRQAASALKTDGILVAQSESPFYLDNLFKQYQEVVQQVFKITRPYLAFIPDYPSGMWSFTFCSNTLNPIKDFEPDKVKKSGLKTRYYNEELHKGAFALPTFVREQCE